MLKHPKFKEENEWRLVMWFPNEELRFREGKSMLIPYSAFYLSDEKKNMPIRRVIIGPTPHRELSKYSVEGLLEGNGIKDCEISFSEVPFRES